MHWIRHRLSRRSLVGLGVLGGLSAGSAFGYGARVERRWIEVTRPKLDVKLGAEAPERLRVALLADFHFDPLCEADYARDYVRLTNLAKPDLVLLLGDFVSDRVARVGELTRELGKLTAPTFAILGNHDFWHGAGFVQKNLEDAGISVLRNRIASVPAAGGRVTLAGLESCWGGKPQPERIRPNAGERLLLAQHEPDFIDRLPRDIRKNVALQVSGHTHGGQICAPFGIVLSRASWGWHYTRGHYDLGEDTHVYVNRGIGTLKIHARFACRPEITVMELRNLDRPENAPKIA